MTARTVFDRLYCLGASVSVVEDKLRVEAPAGVLTPDLKTALIEYKAALIALLRQRVEEDGMPKAPCSRCGGRRFWISRAHGPPTCAACWPPPKNAVWRWITITE